MTVEPIKGCTPPVDPLRLSDGESHFLWSFLQGSTTTQETIVRLRRAWGMCASHAAALLTVEAACSDGRMRASAALYLDLAEQAAGALTAPGPFADVRALRRLRARSPCPVCELSVRGSGASSRDKLDRGHDRAAVGRFAAETERYWGSFVCRDCLGGATGPRCRPHLLGDSGFDLAEEIHSQRATLGHIVRHLIEYARSLRSQERNCESAEDRAALLEAVGWCSGWSVVLADFGLPS
jgi:hypothetical protein